MDAYYVSPTGLHTIWVVDGKFACFWDFVKMCRSAGIDVVEYKNAVRVQINDWSEWDKLEKKYGRYYN